MQLPDARDPPETRPTALPTLLPASPQPVLLGGLFLPRHAEARGFHNCNPSKAALPPHLIDQITTKNPLVDLQVSPIAHIPSTAQGAVLPNPYSKIRLSAATHKQATCSHTRTCGHAENTRKLL